MDRVETYMAARWRDGFWTCCSSGSRSRNATSQRTSSLTTISAQNHQQQQLRKLNTFKLRCQPFLLTLGNASYLVAQKSEFTSLVPWTEILN